MPDVGNTGGAYPLYPLTSFIGTDVPKWLGTGYGSYNGDMIRISGYLTDLGEAIDALELATESLQIEGILKTIAEQGKVKTAQLEDLSVTFAKMDLKTADLNPNLLKAATPALGQTPAVGIVGAQIQDKTIPFSKLDLAVKDLNPNLLKNFVAATEDVPAIGIVGAQIQDKAIPGTKLEDSTGTTNGVTTAKIANEAVTSDKIKPLAIKGSHITELEVESKHLKNASVPLEKLGTGFLRSATFATRQAVKDEAVVGGTGFSISITPPVKVKVLVGGYLNIDGSTLDGIDPVAYTRIVKSIQNGAASNVATTRATLVKDDWGTLHLCAAFTIEANETVSITVKADCIESITFTDGLLTAMAFPA